MLPRKQTDSMESVITVVTPLNKNRWNLNVKATLALRTQHKAVLRVFISEHKWRDKESTEEEALMMLNQGDDSEIPVPAVFMFVPEMLVVANQNTHPGHRLDGRTTVHFGPPAAILLSSDTTKELCDFHCKPDTVGLCK